VEGQRLQPHRWNIQLHHKPPRPATPAPADLTLAKDVQYSLAPYEHIIHELSEAISSNLMCWTLQLGVYVFDVVYWPEKHQLPFVIQFGARYPHQSNGMFFITPTHFFPLVFLFNHAPSTPTVLFHIRRTN
jgi:hypothetical protein